MKHPKSFKRIQQTGAVLLLAGSLVLSSCADPVEQSYEQSDAVSGIEVPAETPPAANTPPEPGAPTDAPAVDDELTNEAELTDDVVTAVFQSAADSYSVPVEELEIVSATAKSWPDGCLGLGGPDEICTFAIVDGWEVVVGEGDNRWVYRTDADGLVVREAEGVES